jgi:hypothetical protein
MTFKEGDVVYCILLKNDDEIYIQSEFTGNIVAFPTEKRAVDFWEKGYESAFKRGLCGATGAMIGYIRCNPKVVYFINGEEMIKTLFNDPPYQQVEVYSGIFGIRCHKNVKELWDNGIEPKLIEVI